jgi:hypothetical protein
MTFCVDASRQWNALLQGGHERTPPEQLQRISSYRVCTWGDPKFRRELEGVFYAYIKRVEKDVPRMIEDESWKTAKASWMTDSQLERLYCNFTQPTLRSVQADVEMFFGSEF